MIDPFHAVSGQCGRPHWVSKLLGSAPQPAASACSCRCSSCCAVCYRVRLVFLGTELLLHLLGARPRGRLLAGRGDLLRLVRLELDDASRSCFPGLGLGLGRDPAAAPSPEPEARIRPSLGVGLGRDPAAAPCPEREPEARLRPPAGPCACSARVGRPASFPRSSFPRLDFGRDPAIATCPAWAPANARDPRGSADP